MYTLKTEAIPVHLTHTLFTRFFCGDAVGQLLITAVKPRLEVTRAYPPSIILVINMCHQAIDVCSTAAHVMVVAADLYFVLNHHYWTAQHLRGTNSDLAFLTSDLTGFERLSGEKVIKPASFTGVKVSSDAPSDRATQLHSKKVS